MATDVIGTDEFSEWFDSLTDDQSEKVALVVEMLADQGVALGFPYCSKISGSKHGAMRELRTSQAGKPLRVLYMFDPIRQAVLLVGGNKVGKGNRWYESAIRIVDRLCDEYLKGV